MSTVAKWEAVSPKGFRIFLEIQYDNDDKALSDVARIEDLLQEKGYTVYSPKWGSKKVEKQVEYIEGRTCPKCGKKLIVNQSTNPRAPKIKCEGSKWDFKAKKDIGCTYVEWEQQELVSAPTPAQVEANEPFMATANQKLVIEDMQFEKKVDMSIDLDSLTYQEAKDIIAGNTK